MIEIPVQYIELKTGEKIAYREIGEGKQPLVLLHGNMSSSVHYQNLMNELKNDFHIYALDLVGFGDSSYNRELNSIQDFSKDVSAFIEEFDLSNVILLGWSTGGGVALETAIQCPTRIAQVVLLDSVGMEGFVLYEKDEHFMPQLDKPLLTKESVAKDPVQVAPIVAMYANGDKNSLKNVWNGAIYTSIQPDEEEYDQYLDAMLKQRNIVDVDYALTRFNYSDKHNGVVMGEDRGKLVTQPILIIHGRNDLVVPVGEAEKWKDYYGDQAELVIFESGGHSLPTDDLKGLAKVIKEKRRGE